MISSLHSNKLILLIFVVFFTVISLSFLCAEEEALNIWEKKEKDREKDAEGKEGREQSD